MAEGKDTQPITAAKPEIRPIEPLGDCVRRVVESIYIPLEGPPLFKSAADIGRWIREQANPADLKELGQRLRIDHNTSPDITLEVGNAFNQDGSNRINASMQRLAFALEATPLDPSILSEESKANWPGGPTDIYAPFLEKDPSYEPVDSFANGLKRVLQKQAVAKVFPLQQSKLPQGRDDKRWNALARRAYLQLMLGACGVIPLRGEGFAGVQDLVRKKSPDKYAPFSHEASLYVSSPLVGRDIKGKSPW